MAYLSEGYILDLQQILNFLSCTKNNSAHNLLYFKTRIKTSKRCKEFWRFPVSMFAAQLIIIGDLL